MEATSLVCVDGVAVLYSGRWFAQGTSAGQHIGQHTLAWAENHLRYLACGQTLCNHSAPVFVLTTAITWCGPTAATRAALQQGQPLQAQIAFQQKRCASAFQQWPHLLAERWSRPFKTQSHMD